MGSKVKIEHRKVKDLIPYARNSRTHSDAQVGQIAASIREFGWTNPILIDGESGIIAGHGRVMAARKLGMDEVPCIELSHLSEAQKNGRVARLMELDPKYCDVIVKRWQQYTGKEAVLNGDGRTFNEVARDA